MKPSYYLLNLLTCLTSGALSPWASFAKDDGGEVQIEEISIDNLECNSVRHPAGSEPEYEIRCKMKTKLFLKLCVSSWPVPDSGGSVNEHEDFSVLFEKTLIGSAVEPGVLTGIKRYFRNVQSPKQFRRHAVAMMQRFCIE